MTVGQGEVPAPHSIWPATGKLGFRFALVLAAALLPLGIVSLFQTRDLETQAQGRTETALLGETLRAASVEVGTIRTVQGVVATLAQAVPTVIDDGPACEKLMRDTAALIPTATLVAYVPMSGLMTCSSVGNPFDFSDNPKFAAARDARAPNFMVHRNGPVSETSVLVVSHPVFAADGAYLGLTSVSLAHSALSSLDQSIDEPAVALGSLLSFWTFDTGGEVLSSNNGLDGIENRLPSSHQLIDFVGQPARVFQDLSGAGFDRTYAVVPLVEGELYLMSSWEIEPSSLLRPYGITPYLPPVVMWVAGLIVAAWAAEYLVSRHVRALNGSIRRFAQGDRRLQELDLRKAPVELQQVGDAYLRMTESIMLGEAQLEDSVHQKEVLLREVHHRVKNNLQLIASIMNMQMRKAVAPEAKSLLKGLQDRVMSLATIHRELYQTSGLVDVRADELFTQIVRQIVNLATGPDKRFDLKLDVDELRLTPDQAVPLTLMLTEAMTNAIKYAGSPPNGAARIEVRLKRKDGKNAILEVFNTVAASGPASDVTSPEAVRIDSDGLGRQLLTAFAQQVGGTLHHGAEDNSYRISLEFEITELEHAEQRRAADTDEEQPDDR